MPRVAPTFGRMCEARALHLPRPNVGAAKPCEVDNSRSETAGVPPKAVNLIDTWESAN